MKKKNKVKWIGSGIFTGICLCLTQAKSMELGGFDVEMGTGEGQEYPSDWWEETQTNGEGETEVGSETEPEQEYWEEPPEQDYSGDILMGEGITEEVSPENPPESSEENYQFVQEQGIYQENPSYSEGQPSSMTGGGTEMVLEEGSATETPIPTITQAVTETPIPSASPLPSPVPTPTPTPGFSSPFMQEASGPCSILQDFSVFFYHLPVPQNQRKPYVEIQSEGQVGIVSVRHNHQECFWWREGNRLFLEMEPAEGENKIEILVITEDCRLVMMEPWIYSGEKK